MVRRIFVRLAVMAGLLVGVFAPLPVYAGTDPFAEVNCDGAASSSTVCATRSNKSDPFTGPDGTLNKVANLFALIAGFAAVIFLVIGGIKYITSGGAADQISKAKQTIIYALVGLVVISASRAIIGFVIGKL